MTLEDLRTIVGIMNNDVPNGRVEMIHVVNTDYAGRYENGQPVYTRDGTVPRNVGVDVVWHPEAEATRLVGRYKTLNSGFPYEVQIEKWKNEYGARVLWKEGIIDSYLQMIAWAAE